MCVLVSQSCSKDSLWPHGKVNSLYLSLRNRFLPFLPIETGAACIPINFLIEDGVMATLGFQGSAQFSCSVVSDSLQPHGLQRARLPCPSPTPGACSNSCPLSWWCHSTISLSVIPFSSAFNLSQHQGLFKWVSSLHQVAKVLEFQQKHQPSNEYSALISFRIDWLVWSYSPRDSQESSPTPQF